MIRLYQRWAPARVRASCRFEPSCSNYMILAINKYGLVRGGCAGVGRLCRCRPPYGGIDYP
jgi:putative membrane protein insertion efficiency factor